MDPDELEQQNLDGADDGSQRSEAEELAAAPSNVDALDYEDEDLEDPDETDLEDDTRAEELEPEPAPAARTTPKVAPSPRPAPTVAAVALTPEQQTELDDLFLTDQNAWFERKMELRDQQRDQQRRVTNHYTREVEQQYPEFMRDHAEDVEQMVEQYVRNPQNLNNPNVLKEGQRVGILNAVFKDAGTDGDLLAAMERAVAKMKGTKASARPGPAPKAPLPREQRVPVPSGGGAARASNNPARNGQTRSGQPRSLDFLTKHLGLDPATARALRSDL